MEPCLRGTEEMWRSVGEEQRTTLEEQAATGTSFTSWRFILLQRGSRLVTSPSLSSAAERGQMYQSVLRETALIVPSPFVSP